MSSRNERAHNEQSIIEYGGKGITSVGSEIKSISARKDDYTLSWWNKAIQASIQPATQLTKLPQRGQRSRERYVPLVSPPLRLIYLMTRLSKYAKLNSRHNGIKQQVTTINKEIGIHGSEVEMWVRRMRNVWSSGARGETPVPFIHNGFKIVVRLIKDLVRSVNVGLSWGLYKLESNLLLALKAGSVALFQVLETLLLSIWNPLWELLQIDFETSDELYSIVDVLENAFNVTRSLIHLGIVWRNSRDISDWEYTQSRSRSSTDYHRNLKADDKMVE